MKKQTNTKTKPMVSVLMPVYNAGKFLAPAIESIRKQTVTNFELLIIDDGSTDKTPTILKRYTKKDKRIRIFRNKKNVGLVKSLNSIIKKTRGAYVARMDADDIAYPKRFEKQIALLESNPRLVACGGQVEIIDEKGKIIAEKKFPIDPATCYNTIMNVMVIQPPALMARGKIFRTLKYENHLFKNDDISMHFKLLKFGQFSNVEDTIFQYRRRPDSLTHKTPKKVYFLALLVRINAIKKHGYAPTFQNLLLALIETFVVAILPNQAIIWLFELMRHSNKQMKQLLLPLRQAYTPA